MIRLAAVALCASLLGACATTPDGPSEALQERVYQQIRLEPTVDSTRVTADVEDGVVTLNGFVDVREDERRIVEAARAVEGVRSVDSNIIISD